MFRLVDMVLMNRTTFWSFQANFMTLPSSDKLPYSLPYSKVKLHLGLSSESISISPRFESIFSCCALVPSSRYCCCTHSYGSSESFVLKL